MYKHHYVRCELINGKSNFLHELPIEQLQQISQEDIEQTLKAEQLYFQHRPRTLYYLAVNGSKTKQGGLVKASATQGKIGDLSIARIGDDVIYADGTIANIISGADMVADYVKYKKNKKFVNYNLESKAEIFADYWTIKTNNIHVISKKIYPI
ncbi:PAAR domain-containing protein [Acinetobacter ursingii]|uniref:PAAR domain-containing protein n=1 Tax=Acinetobacter ursingii TaxID=108980 RepID=UPI000A64A7E4|nr:PAAR domain-containing protein [Acinetobacter ursingii]MCH2005975.1 PAAR domain-containing protein [Acinetobacter ursingii]